MFGLDSSFLFFAASIAVILVCELILVILRLRILLGLWNDKPIIGLFLAFFLLYCIFFRLKDDGVINPKLVRLAALHDRLQLYTIWFMGAVCTIVIIVVACQKAPRLPLPNYPFTS
jgi:hypothetical protein